MADALISFVLEQLASYLQREITLVMDTRQQVTNLTRNLKLIQAVLADADRKQVKSEAVRVWLDSLKQVVYNADDVLDEWRTKNVISRLQSKADVASGSRKKVLSYLLSPCFCFKNVIVHYDIGHQIKDINEQLDVIAKQRKDYGLEEQIHQTYDETRFTSSVVDASKIHGRDKSKDDIISRIFAESSSQGTTLRVISIVGAGGLGKTTLARLIFNDERVVEVLNTKMWVCVSDPFSMINVAKSIIKEAAGVVPDSTVWQEVHKCLCQSVTGKKFLLVLDDVWTENPDHWSQLKLALDSGAPGSRIIVTTRHQNVARIMGSVDHDIHNLEKLSVEDSWLVIRDVALFGKVNDLNMFEKIGKEIATKCKGVPLAITILASVLCSRQTKEDWKSVLSSDIWEMQEIKDFFIPSLLLSYYSLDSISKQCFLYCAIFPKDYKMSKVLLIRLWMAQGFFGYEGNDLEKIGEDHFRILVMRSFFQDFEKDSSGNITHCKMHDLVHDFAMYLSQNESCFLQDGDKLRHLFAVNVDITQILKAKSLRTLFLMGKSAVPIELFDKLMCLRTLDLSYCALEVLPVEVENLMHLRYLDLSHTKLLELPETVCNLYNLQFLGLKKCGSLHTLPKKIGKLSNLRHLDIEGTNALSYFPKSFAALSSLRSLCKFIVSGGEDECKIGDLQLLNNLRGVLELKGLSKVRDVNDAIRAKLKMKKHLRELTFDFKEEESGVRNEMKNVLEKLKPHEDLEILKIRDYSESQFPGWVQSCSPLANVVEIILIRCAECTELPAFGKLAYLKTLEIKSMGSVISIGKEFYGVGAQMTSFPKLESFVIEDMEKLEEWEVPISKDRKIMPLLRYMKLYRFPMLRALPCLGNLESLKELSIWGMKSVKYIGNEFYGFDGDNSSGVELIAFPKLEKLWILTFDELEEWEIPISKNRKMMPLLSLLKLEICPKLRELRVWRMEALEKLKLLSLHSVKRVGVEFVGDKEGSLQDGVTFPKLKKLHISSMPELEEWGVPLITPCLKKLSLFWLPKLKRLPTFKGCVETLEFLDISFMDSWEGQEKIVINEKEGNSSGGDSCALRSLAIKWCRKLRVVPDHLFSPSLEELELEGDVGVLYDSGSFPALCSIITNLSLRFFPYSSLPKGFHQLKALQRLQFHRCDTLDFDLKELGELTMLQHLEITWCPLLQERFKGDDWRNILAHIPTIKIGNKEITKKS